MEYSKNLDDMCIRLNDLNQELLRRRSPCDVLNAMVSEAVDLVQQIGGSLAWAYGQSAKGSRMGEQFAQPFVDRRVTERFRELLTTGNAQLQAQVLQTIHILLQSTPKDSTLFCNLTAGWYLNQVVTAEYDFRSNEDLLHLWMTVVKDIALMMDAENLMLFFDPAAEKPFPIFGQSARFYHHPVAQVRTQVQATSLEIFTKLKAADAWMDDLFGLVVADSKILFTHVVCLLRHFWRKTEEAARSSEHRKEKQEFMRLQNDILMYLADVFTCEVPQLSTVLQERLLRFAVLPVLMGSALQLQCSQHAMLSQETSWAIFYDFLQTLRSCRQMLVILATLLLRPYVTEEVLQLVTSPAPRAPLGYFEVQKSWGGRAQGTTSDGYDAHRPDSVLYESMPIKFASELRRTNRLRDAFLERTSELYEKGRVKAATNSLKCLTLLLEAFSAESLEKSVAEALGLCLARCLARHGEASWSLCLAALKALRQLLEVSGSTAALAALRERLLKPLATELIHEAALQSQQGGLSGQEAWLQDFQEQWMATGPAEAGESEPLSGRARSFRVLLAVVRLLKGKVNDMPGKDEAESDENARYSPGSVVYLGKQNRVRCRAAAVSSKALINEEDLYLIPTNNTLVLVRPEEQKAFYGEVVISEPLRLIKLKEGDENSAPGPENEEHYLRIEVFSPNSQFLKGLPPRTSGYPSYQGNDFEASWFHGHPMRQTLTESQPAAMAKGPAELLLIFSDAPRRKVAWKVIHQAQYSVCNRLFDGILKFLTSVKNGGIA